jgi:membrane-bound serine protease (ClpP class)
MAATVFLLLAVCAAVLPADAPATDGKILVLTISGPITPSAAEYVEIGFAHGRDTKARLVIIEMDTPGGLDKSMRAINREILNSAVPVVVYVSPSGARAASAGTFITLAADVAAMAPGTTIGAAHPVSLVGQNDETMIDKVTNDSAAYIRSLAERYGRNADWAEKAVRDSVSLTASAALEEKVIDLVADDFGDLLEKIHGREAARPGGSLLIETKGRMVERLKMDFRRRVLDVLSDPNIAYLLLMLGALGIFFEFSNPGAIYPGVIGAMAIILALYSLQTLPVNYAGLLLIAFAIVLFFVETQVASFGLLTLGGTVALFMGSLMLFRSPAPWLRVSLAVIVPTVAFTTFFFVVVVQRVVSTYRRKPSTGMEGIVGETGEAMTDLDPGGRVYVHGEIWNAHCPGGAVKGDVVRVVSARGMVIEVQKVDQGG